LAKFVKGEIVVIPFPFSDLTQAKRRPALILAALEGDDLILCQITSQAIKDNYAISVTDDDFEAGGLKRPSNVRPNRIFTADTHLALYRVGTIRKEKLNQVIERVVEIVRK
jgi:mRNA interferase MazF